MDIPNIENVHGLNRLAMVANRVWQINGLVVLRGLAKLERVWQSWVRSLCLEVHIIFSLGVLLVGAILAELVRVPKVTAYLLVGLALEPHALKLLPEAHVHSLEPFNDMAMATAPATTVLVLTMLVRGHRR